MQLTEIILGRMSDIALDQSTWKWIAVLVCRGAVSILRKEADVVTLGTNNDRKLDLEDCQPEHTSFEIRELTLAPFGPTRPIIAFLMCATSSLITFAN